MSALGRFEQFMESMMEGSARRLFRSRITAAEITRRLERAMESQQTITVDRVIVPSIYRAFLHPDDFQSFEPIQDELEKEMSIYLLELAQERRFTLLQHPVVDVAPNPSTPRHGVQIQAEMASQASGAVSNNMYNSTLRMPTPPSRGAAPQARPSRTELVLRLPDGEYVYPLPTTPVILGRGLDNDVVLDDPRVSRRHAKVWQNGGRFMIADQGSTNGTFVNGTPVANEHVLQPGDMVSLGGLELAFR